MFKLLMTDVPFAHQHVLNGAGCPLQQHSFHCLSHSHGFNALFCFGMHAKHYQMNNPIAPTAQPTGRTSDPHAVAPQVGVPTSAYVRPCVRQGDGACSHSEQMSQTA